MPFFCSICGEESTRICARCTKDACNNHLCEKCLRCSDCCECEVALTETAPGPPLGSARAAIRAAAESHATESHAVETHSAEPYIAETYAAEVQVSAPVATEVETGPEPEPLPPGPNPDPDPTPAPTDPGTSEV